MVVVLSLFAGGNPDLWLQNNLVEFLMVTVLLLQGSGRGLDSQPV